MILGHEASGVIVEVGADVTELKDGDRVCMEPGIPDPTSRASAPRQVQSRSGRALLGDAAGPRHPAPDRRPPGRLHLQAARQRVARRRAPWCEPLADRRARRDQGARSSRATPRVVTGAGPIGLVTLLAARAAGCARVIVSDVDEAKLDLAEKLGAVGDASMCARRSWSTWCRRETDGWGVDVVFECSGNERRRAAVVRRDLPRRARRLHRHAAGADRLRRHQGGGQGGAGRARLPLRPRLPALRRHARLRRDRRDAPDHQDLRLRGQRAGLRVRRPSRRPARSRCRSRCRAENNRTRRSPCISRN